MIKNKFLKASLFLLPILPTATLVACAPTNNSEHTVPDAGPKINENKKTNQTLDFTNFGVKKFNGQVKTRTLLFAAATSENFLDKDGVFSFRLHHRPVEGVKGEWLAFATEVKGRNDNTLVDPLNIKIASTQADEGAGVEYPLRFKFDKPENKLGTGKYYTFVFWKKDGTERIVFNQTHIDNNNDIFPSFLPN
ncbi:MULTISPECIES: hypothetical protein [unclassified Mycoplasma]|uniref:hypothetical protein n=1 Tax=Mycoplasma sp. 125 TaxID=3447505 RepID=UPI003F65EE8F